MDQAISDLREEERLRLDIDGWEGPLDLLLSLARTQKVDLKAISILELVEQYLTYINRARALSVELAADYLVMAAWLALLKSAMLLPREAQPDPDPEELALRLQLRLQRLAAMRDAGARLMARDRVGRDIFLRGTPEGLARVRSVQWEADLFDLMRGYGAVKARTAPVVHMVAARHVMTLDTAIARLSKMIGVVLDWTDLRHFLPDVGDNDLRRSSLASSFVAALELARQGRLDMQQAAPFAPLLLRRAG